MTASELSRRAFLARTGLLDAGALLVPGCVGPDAGTGAGANTGAEIDALELAALVQVLRPVLGQLARDTLNGFIAFIVPGCDVYSEIQGTPRGEPGGISAGGTDFLLESLDRLLPMSERAVRPAASALITALTSLPLPLPSHLLGGALAASCAAIRLVEDAVLYLIENDRAAPLSLPVALLLNYVATVINPAAIHGPLLSPFARLSLAEKAHAMEMLETGSSELVALIDTQVPDPLKPAVAQLLAFVGSALHEFAAFGSFSDLSRPQPAARRVPRHRDHRGDSAAWQLAFAPDLLGGDGWDDPLAPLDRSHGL